MLWYKERRPFRMCCYRKLIPTDGFYSWRSETFDQFKNPSLSQSCIWQQQVKCRKCTSLSSMVLCGSLCVLFFDLCAFTCIRPKERLDLSREAALLLFTHGGDIAFCWNIMLQCSQLINGPKTRSKPLLTLWGRHMDFSGFECRSMYACTVCIVLSALLSWWRMERNFYYITSLYEHARSCI